MITIGLPVIANNDDKTRLEVIIDIDGRSDTIWFEVESKYGEYLCYERSDAFVIGVLNYAMRNGHDITCMAPMGEELNYQISTYLIDAVYKGSDKLYNTKIFSDIDTNKILSANAVGTGISCGIDSFHAISTHSKTIYPNHNITHLAFFNVGSHGEGEKAFQLFYTRKQQSIRFAREYGYEFVDCNSNIHDIVPQNHFLTHTYTSSFAIYALQKLFSKYYYSSGRTFFDFTLDDTFTKDCSYYDLLLSDIFSTSTLKIFSEGATFSRLEKTKLVAEFEPSYKYLNVCISTANNCGNCEKCIRTMLTLDALRKLEKYNLVFDIEYYQRNTQKYYQKLIYYKFQSNINYVEIFPLLKDQIHFTTMFFGFIKYVKYKIIFLVPYRFKLFLKRLLIR